MGGLETTSIDGEWVAERTEMTEPDRQALDRVRADGGETNREGPARGEVSRGWTSWDRLALLRALVAVV